MASLRPIQINARFAWWPQSSLIAWAHWASNTELSTVLTLQLRWISEKLLYRWVNKKLQSQRWSPNLHRPFLRACEFSKLFNNYFPTSSVIMYFILPWKGLKTHTVHHDTKGEQLLPSSASIFSRETRWLSANTLSTFRLNTCMTETQEATRGYTQGTSVVHYWVDAAAVFQQRGRFRMLTSCSTWCLSREEALGLLLGSSCRHSCMKRLLGSSRPSSTRWMASCFTGLGRPSPLPRRSR